MSQSLPPRPDPAWYRKAARKKLSELRRLNPAAKLAAAQFAVARAHHFASWPKLIAAVSTRRQDNEITRLRRAIELGQTLEAKRLLSHSPALAKARINDASMLGIAIEHHQPDIVRMLIRSGADLYAVYAASSHTALSWAITVNALDCVAALREAGAQPDLFCAAGLGDLPSVKKFFDAHGRAKPGASLTGSTRFDSTGKRLPCPPQITIDLASDALYLACRNGHAKVVAFLLTQKVNLNFKAYHGGAPLHWAYFSASAPAIQSLLAAGADPAARDDTYRCTPRAFGICVAAHWGRMTLLKRSLRLDPTLVNILDGRATPLHEAARAGNAGIIRALLKAGADPTLKDHDGLTPLELAAQQGHVAVVPLLKI